MSLFGKILKVAKSVVKSPILKVAAGGLAVAFPPAGLGLAAVASAGKVLDAAKGIIGTPAQQQAAKRAVENTVRLAKAGNVEAKAGVKAMQTAEKAKAIAAARGIHIRRKPAAAPARRTITTTGTPVESGWHINHAGRIRVIA